MNIFDSHAHYYDARFSEEGVDTDALLASLFDKDVRYILNVATNNTNAAMAIDTAKKYPGMYTALGIHPSDIDKDKNVDNELKTLENLLKDKQNKAVALGEIGLDYHYEPYDIDLQKLYFKRQLELAKKLDLPVCVHIRDAQGDAFDMLMASKGSRGVIHSYSGSPEMAKEYARHGYFVSFSGTVTFKNASKVKESVLALPRGNVLVETDCPYLAPHPLRGTLNHSGNLIYTLTEIANLWGVPVEEAAETTFENAKRLFGI